MTHPHGTRPEGMVAVDLDGTLLRSDGTVAKDDLRVLRAAGAMRIWVVLATGRNMWSLERASLPRSSFHRVVFSSGCGVLDWTCRGLLEQRSLGEDQTAKALSVCLQLDLDVMVHQPIPENHRFAWRRSGRPNPDFERRLALYGDYCEPLGRLADRLLTATQLIAIVPAPNAVDVLEQVRAALPELSVMRATSPLDGQSTWIEIYPPGVSKRAAVARLAEQWGLSPDNVLAVGNDWNDLDLLEWAGSAAVVANAPPELRRRFHTVAHHDACGVAEAVRWWWRDRRRPDAG